MEHEDFVEVHASQRLSPLERELKGSPARSAIAASIPSNPQALASTTHNALLEIWYYSLTRHDWRHFKSSPRGGAFEHAPLESINLTLIFNESTAVLN